jgi:hypothetical protein
LFAYPGAPRARRHHERGLRADRPARADWAALRLLADVEMVPDAVDIAPNSFMERGRR